MRIALIAASVVSAALLAGAVERPLDQTAGRAAPKGQPTPGDVAQRFCRLDADGAQLSPSGWAEIASLFAQPGPRHPVPARITVVKDDFGVSKATMIGDRKAAVRMGYSHLGDLDTGSAIFKAGPPFFKLRGDLNLVLVDSVKSGEHSMWMIEGPVPKPVITLRAATRYVNNLRNTTMDPAVKRNAERTLAALKRLQ